MTKYTSSSVDMLIIVPKHQSGEKDPLVKENKF